MNRPACLSLLALLAAAPTTAQQFNLDVGNGLPPAGGAVEIRVAGAPFGLPVAFGSTRRFVLASSGATTVEAFRPGAATPFLSTTINDAPDTDFAVFVHLDASGQPRISGFQEDGLPILFSGPARFTARHLAAAGSVDVQLRSVTNGISLGSIARLTNGNDRTLDLPDGRYELQVVPTGGSTPVLGPLPITLEPGRLHVVSVVGDAATGFAASVVRYDRRRVLVQAGQDCEGVISRFAGTLAADGRGTLDAALVNLPSAGIVLLNVGITPNGSDLGRIGAPGCQITVDPLLSIPVPVQFGVATFSARFTPAQTAAAPVTAWQFVFTGALNAAGLGTSQAGVLGFR